MAAGPASSDQVNTPNGADARRQPDQSSAVAPPSERWMQWLIMAVATVGGATIALMLGLAAAVAFQAEARGYGVIFIACALR